MSTYIMIADEAYVTNTDEEVAAARAALRDAGIEETPEIAGVPDGAGDSYRNGNKLFAAKPAGARKAIIRARGNGLAGVGEYVSCDGAVYRVTALVGPIHTGKTAGADDYIHAEVELADWSDVDDDSEPRCSAEVV